MGRGLSNMGRPTLLKSASNSMTGMRHSVRRVRWCIHGWCSLSSVASRSVGHFRFSHWVSSTTTSITSTPGCLRTVSKIVTTPPSTCSNSSRGWLYAHSSGVILFCDTVQGVISIPINTQFWPSPLHGLRCNHRSMCFALYNEDIGQYESVYCKKKKSWWEFDWKLWLNILLLCFIKMLIPVCVISIFSKPLKHVSSVCHWASDKRIFCSIEILMTDMIFLNSIFYFFITQTRQDWLITNH